MAQRNRSKSAGHWPREHGAWAQLLIPLAASLLRGRPSLPAALLAVAGIALFAAHEPLLVLRGSRGKRLQQQEGQDARRHLLQRLLVAGVAGLPALAHVQPEVVWAALAALSLGLLQLVLALAGKHKSLAGEWLAGGVLVAVAIPVALATQVSLADALRAALTWTGGFALMTTAVHACKARALGQPHRARLLALTLAAAVAGLVLGVLQPQWRPLMPMAAAALGLIAVPIRLRWMARVGWALAVASLGALVLQLNSTTLFE